MTSSTLIYSDLVIGTEYGPYSWEVKCESINKYLEAVEDNYPAYKEREYAQNIGYKERIAPPTIAAIYFLDAYNKAFPRRYPGGIHVKQYFEFREPAVLEEKLITRLKIIDKYIRKDRLYVQVQGITEKESGSLVSTGIMTVIWAK
jgi:acyl dehydratase